MPPPTLLASISRPDLSSLIPPPPSLATITDITHLSSYNWIEAPTPTISIPGSPSLWSPPRGRAPRELKKDTGLIYIAQNAARHPQYPLEPLFRALYLTADPSFDIHAIDIVTDRNNIRKLLSFVNPASSRGGLKEAFTINVEVTGKTAIFARDQTATTEVIGPHEFRGYGHEFEKVYTTNQISGSTGHHRVISYRFGGLSFVVRHETDGYVDAAGTTTRPPPPPQSSSSLKSSKEPPESDSLTSMLGSLSLSSPTSSSNPPASAPATASKLTIREEGKAVPLGSTLEIKTRVFHKPLTIEEVAPQLWVSQTPKLVRAYHRRGTFEGPEVEDVAAAIKTWEERNQTDLRRLAALIKRILEVVKGSGGGSAVVRYDVKEDTLVVRKVVDAKKMLPEDLYSKWNDGDRDGSEAETSKEHGPRAEESAGKPGDGVEIKAQGKSIGSGAGDKKKGEKAAETAKDREQGLLHDLFPSRTQAEDTISGSQDKGEEACGR